MQVHHVRRISREGQSRLLKLFPRAGQEGQHLWSDKGQKSVVFRAHFCDLAISKIIFRTFFNTVLHHSSSRVEGQRLKISVFVAWDVLEKLPKSYFCLSSDLPKPSVHLGEDPGNKKEMGNNNSLLNLGCWLLPPVNSLDIRDQRHCFQQEAFAHTSVWH